MRCTVSLNLAVLDHYPAIAAAMAERQWDVMCHGVYNTRYVEGMNEQEESELYGLCQEIARRHLGYPARGMLGPFITANEGHATGWSTTRTGCTTTSRRRCAPAPDGWWRCPTATS
ncbi:hypothetical protein Vqi01_47500 [Micromonospora qiuiae]|uniref:NodB homology domain-containing protein n=1 Tax=Micromonospora qiuiae TaxID=502268 RepID=A0ABQ4JGD8_9ACTN|nr:hypothetical protein [Micromonospora qiuiae]GIJ29588.1 hypothetical protein Vqi01_47500 [Micromonospora qiuiae]